MPAPTYKTLEQLIAAAEEFIDQIDTVSFDVFDTLFIRRIENPDLIKIPVARFIAEKANQAGITMSWFEIAALRDEIENQHRQRNGEHYPDFEANYDQFMPEVLNQVFAQKLPESFLQQVAEYEIRLENAMLVPRAALVQWIESLKQRGKRLFLISDIYLPAKYIQQMAVAKNLDHFFEGIVSSADSFNAKASGTAYPLIEQQYHLDKAKWLHVGDNPISDGTRPIEFGIKSLVINDPAECHRKNLARHYNFYSTHNTFWKGRNLKQLMLPLEAENSEQPELYVQGFNQFGFLFGFFMQRLAQRCKELKLKRIYFCSREGWLLKQCWERFAPWYFPDGDMPEARYLYVSRIALARAMIGNTGLSTTEVEVALLPNGNNCFADVCRIFDLDAQAFAPYLEKHKIKLNEVIAQTDPNASANSRRKLGIMLMDSEFQATAKKSGQANRDAFVSYLSSEGFFDYQEVGLVDIGWLGTIHNNFFQALSHRLETPRIHGFLMCATRHIEYKNTRDRYFEGLVYDRHRFEVGGSLVQYIKDIMEEICRAPHTSLVAYHPADNDQGFELEFRSDDDESAQAEHIQSDYYQPVQNGILDAVSAYAKAQTVLGYGCAEVKPWLNLSLYKFLAFPRTKDVVRLQLKAHQDDFAKRETKSYKKFLDPEKGLWQYSQAVLNFWPAIRMRSFKKHCIRMMKG